MLSPEKVLWSTCPWFQGLGSGWGREGEIPAHNQQTNPSSRFLPFVMGWFTMVLLRSLHYFRSSMLGSFQFLMLLPYEGLCYSEVALSWFPPGGQKGKGYILTTWGKTPKRVRRRGSFWREFFFEISSPMAFQFLGSRPTVNMCSDTISIATQPTTVKSPCFLCHPWISMLAHTVLRWNTITSHVK